MMDLASRKQSTGGGAACACGRGEAASGWGACRARGRHSRGQPFGPAS